MKFIALALDGMPPGPAFRLELTRRNLVALLDKLDEPSSHRTLIDQTGAIEVVAVEDAEHYKTRRPGLVFMPDTGCYR